MDNDFFMDEDEYKPSQNIKEKRLDPIYMNNIESNSYCKVKYE
jgi:hypothetical protein